MFPRFFNRAAASAARGHFRQSVGGVRNMGGVGGKKIPGQFHHEPTDGPDKNVGHFLFLLCYLWIMYRAKENNGQIFGFNLPWNVDADDGHHHAVHYVPDEDDETPEIKAPKIQEEEEHEDEEEEED
jgi:hypothetical protein